MNAADSDLLLAALAHRGFSPAPSPHQADLIIVNTCSVREHAEKRALARITEIAAIKRARSNAKLWVVGCMAERLGADLIKKIPAIDAVIGAPELADPEEVVRHYLGQSGFGSAVSLQSRVSEFFPVMRGCDNFCAYCIVPYVRGRESSVPADELVSTISARVEAGVREVTLLGQNVNSYRDGNSDFPDLLRRIASIPQLRRIRFTTSHPKDCTEKLVQTMAECGNICRHLHLPVQSGSDRILSLMNRRYTADHYRSLVGMIRKLIPAIDITTDILVGFPSETDEEFSATLALVEEVGFTTAFMFAYSVRRGTKAAELEDTVPYALKIERLNRLIRLQTSITGKIYAGSVGRTLEMMVDGPMEKRGEKFLRGLDRGCKRILIPCTDLEPGTILPVIAERSSGMTLIARRSDR